MSPTNEFMRSVGAQEKAENISGCDAMFYRIRQTRMGGRVQRSHTIPHKGSYSVAEHSWGVAMLAKELFPSNFPALVLACLAHDVPEAWVGDIPATVFSEISGGPSLRVVLMSVEQAILEKLNLEYDLPYSDTLALKVCDSLELYTWCLEELAVGNRHVLSCMDKLSEYLNDVFLKVDKNPQEFTYSFKNAKNYYGRLVFLSQSTDFNKTQEVQEIIGTYEGMLK